MHFHWPLRSPPKFILEEVNNESDPEQKRRSFSDRVKRMVHVEKKVRSASAQSMETPARNAFAKYGNFFKRASKKSTEAKESQSERKASRTSTENSATVLAGHQLSPLTQSVSPLSRTEPVIPAGSKGIEDIQTVPYISVSVLQSSHRPRRLPTPGAPAYFDIQVPKSSSGTNVLTIPPRRQGQSFADESDSTWIDPPKIQATTGSLSTLVSLDVEGVHQEDMLVAFRGRSSYRIASGSVSTSLTFPKAGSTEAEQPKVHLGDKEQKCQDKHVQPITKKEPRSVSSRLEDDDDSNAAGTLVIVGFIALSALIIILMAIANILGGFAGNRNGETGMSKGFEVMIAFTLDSWPLQMQQLEVGHITSQTATIDSDDTAVTVAILEGVLDGTRLESETHEGELNSCAPSGKWNSSRLSNRDEGRYLHQPGARAADGQLPAEIAIEASKNELSNSSLRSAKPGSLADASQSASADTAPADAALSETSNIIDHHCTRKEASLLEKSPGHEGRDFNALLHREQHETSYREWEPIDWPNSAASALQTRNAEPMVLGLASKVDMVVCARSKLPPAAAPEVGQFKKPAVKLDGGELVCKREMTGASSLTKVPREWMRQDDFIRA